MDFSIAKSVFESLYSGVNGYQISSRARKKLAYVSKSHTYGEVTPESFSQIFQELDLKPGGNFYDLGSGTGKAVILAAIFGKFARLTGIEMIVELHRRAVEIFKRFEIEVKPLLSDSQKKERIEFINGDFLEWDFSDADVVFAHATCFHDEMMIAVERKLSELKKSAKVLLVTKTLISPAFRLIKTEMYPMTWGKATVNFYEKVL